jgi:glycosyltransferase involved in cell wall biosynthesis
MSNYKLSIITINFNNFSGLKRTVESVINQTYKDFEYIVIDGGSTDGSAAYVQEVKQHISYAVSEPDKGIYNAMNKGISRAGGEYLLFLNSGDVLATEDILFNLIKFANGDYGLISGDLRFRENNCIQNSPHELSFDFFLKGSLPHCSTLISMGLFKELGHYQEEYSIVSDWVFFVKCYLQKVNYLKLDIVISIFDIPGASGNRLLELEERDRALINLLSQTCNNIETYDVNLIITYYNMFDEVEEALDSWFSLPFLRLNVVVIDDCSTYAFPTYLCKRFPIKLITNEKNLGVSASRNIGLKNLRPDYKYTIFFDADDLVCKSIYSLFKRLSVTNCIGAFAMCKKNGEYVNHNHPLLNFALKSKRLNYYQSDIFLYGILEAFVLIKTEYLILHNYKWPERTRYSEGIPFYFDVFSHGDLLFVDFFCFDYRLKATGLSSSQTTYWKICTQRARKEIFTSHRFKSLNNKLKFFYVWKYIKLEIEIFQDLLLFAIENGKRKVIQYCNFCKS